MNNTEVAKSNLYFDDNVPAAVPYDTVAPDYQSPPQIGDDDVKLLYDHIIKNNMPQVANPGKGRLRDLKIERDEKKSSKYSSTAAETKKTKEKYGFGSSVARQANKKTEKEPKVGNWIDMTEKMKMLGMNKFEGGKSKK